MKSEAKKINFSFFLMQNIRLYTGNLSVLRLQSQLGNRNKGRKRWRERIHL